MNFRKAATASAILLGLTVSSAAHAAADGGQFGNGNVSQTGGGTSSDNGNSSVTNLRINGHALTIRTDNGATRVWIDNEEVFGQRAADAIHAARTGQPWW